MAKLFEVPTRIELAYRNQIFKLVNREIPTGLSYQNIDEWLDRLASISSDESFLQSAEIVARTMVRDTNLHNVFSWRETGRKSTGGSRVNRSLHETKRGAIGQAIRVELAESIETVGGLPFRIAERLKKEIAYARQEGATEQGCLNILRARLPSLITSRIKLIARTDPHRVNSSFTEARSEDLQLNCFIWTTVGDTSVRHAHDKMNGVVVFWSDLPSPEALIGMPAGLGHYAPGGCPNCRCIAFPVISIVDLFANRTRIKVYTGGLIRRVTQSQFIELVA